MNKEQVKAIREKNMNLKFIREEDIDLTRYFGLIYMTIFPDGMIYVGLTKRIPLTKKYEDYYGSGCVEFKQKLDKNFADVRKVILHVVRIKENKLESQKSLNSLEIFYQKKTKCCDPLIGYNLNEGSNVKRNSFKVIYINNGIKTRQLRFGSKIPDGYEIGRTKDEIERMRVSIVKSNKNKNRISITNGIKQKLIQKDTEIPQGWIIGVSENSKKVLGNISRKTKRFGTNNHNFNKRLHRITDGILEKMIDINDVIPTGWNIGNARNTKRKNPPTLKGINNSMYGAKGVLCPAFGKKWYNNGVHNKYFSENGDIPSGYVRGFNKDLKRKNLQF